MNFNNLVAPKAAHAFRSSSPKWLDRAVVKRHHSSKWRLTVQLPLTASENSDTKSAPLSVIPLQINGQEIKRDTTFDVINPSTGKVIWKASAAPKEHAIRAVEAAHNNRDRSRTEGQVLECKQWH